MSDVRCIYCNWYGNIDELDGISCPNCKNAKYIEDEEPEYYYDDEVLGNGDFNWNKK